jgi:VWFA-related protein
MRQFILLLLSALIVIPAGAAKRSTVAQLEQALNAAVVAHKSDIEIARKISDVELSERLTDIALGRLNKQFASGSRPVMALLLLADRSAFLDPPANELPATPTPDAATQQHLLEAAKRYAVDTLPHLPNLLATRTTFSFDDSPQEVTKGAYLERIGLHLTGSSKAEVSVRNEKENQLTRTGSASSHAQGGLMTWGEFGPTLLIILSDSGEGKMAWSHWEKTASDGVVAVFHYEVPKTASHYEIDTPVEQYQPNGGSNRWAYTGGKAAMTVSSTTAMVRTKPGYQGSLWVDPATGTILRVTLVADLKGNSTIERGAILVDYGPVTIADKTVICPVRSLALSSAPATINATFAGTATAWLNENLFTDYHMFASTSRILSEQFAESDLSTTPITANARNDQASPADGQKPRPETASTLPVPQQAATPSAQVPSDAPASTSVAKVETPEQNSASNAADLLREQRPAAALLPAAPTTASSTASQPRPSSPTPVTPPSNAETQYSAPSIEVNVNRVLVPVVVRNKEGHTVGNLTKENFRAFDNEKERPISGFFVERRGPGNEQNGADSKSRTSQATSDQALPNRILVFLFDDLHLSYEDIARSTKAASAALAVALGDSDIAAVVSTSGKTNSGLTRDPAKLREALTALRPQGLYRTYASDCPQMDYYQADLIQNKHDNEALQDAIRQVMFNCNPNLPSNLAQRVAEAAASRVLTLGSQDVRATYAATEEFVRRIATMPGQRTMIVISSGFLALEQESRTQESRLINLAAQSNVTISAIDARGLYTASLMASDNTQNRILDVVEDYRRRSMHFAENSMGELAEGTGGRFIHNSNDLEAGFKTLANAPDTIYVLELSLDSIKMDGSYHRLKVKLNQGGFDVSARHGYFVPKLQKNMK